MKTFPFLEQINYQNMIIVISKILFITQLKKIQNSLSIKKEKNYSHQSQFRYN